MTVRKHKFTYLLTYHHPVTVLQHNGCGDNSVSWSWASSKCYG